MTSIASAAVDGFSLGQSLADLANVSARPTFELQYSILQNSLLDRLSKKIDEYNSDSGVNKVDAFLTLEKKRLERIIPNVTKYAQETTNNYLAAGGMIDDLTQLGSLASGGNADAFNNLRDRISADLQRIKNVSGLTIGMNVKDGLIDLQSTGLGIDDYDSYADASSRTDAVTAALAKVQNSLSVLIINLDGARTYQDTVQSKISSVTLQIEATQTAEKAEKLQEINKLKDDTTTLLKTLSLAFEVNASRSEAFTQALLNPSGTTQGTIADLVSSSSGGSASSGSILNLLA